MREILVRQLSALQQRKVTLDDFELWLVGNLGEILASADEELKYYADRLDALLIQSSEGIVTEAELDQELEGALRNLSTVMFVVSPGRATGEGSAHDVTQVTPVVLVEAPAAQDVLLPVVEVA